MHSPSLTSRPVGTSVIPLGDKPMDYFEHSRSDLVDRLPLPLGCVLDVGCGAGGVAAEIRRRGVQRLVGIERDAAAAAAARSICDEVVVDDAPAAVRTLPDRSFDTVVCYDLLEHLYDPAAVLRDLHRVVVAGGRLHVSVPNARHASLFRDLYLKGTFGYTPFGHRDSTHIRWFTRTDLERLLTEAGWTVTETTTHPFKPYRALLTRLSGGRLSEVFAVQWFVLCRA